MYLPIPSNETTYPSGSSIKDSNENQPQKVRQETNIKSWAPPEFLTFLVTVHIFLSFLCLDWVGKCGESDQLDGESGNSNQLQWVIW